MRKESLVQFGASSFQCEHEFAKGCFLFKSNSNWISLEQFLPSLNRRIFLFVCIVYSENITLKETEETDSDFRERIYKDYFIYEKIRVDLTKYIDYPDFYHQLDENQKKEVDTYLENHLEKRGKNVPHKYIPSNHAKDELNAHTKTLDVSSLGLFEISSVKENYYTGEALTMYQKMYNKNMEVEREYGYTSEGYK
jgi:hypothetical protein